jgi:phytoene dehydrogenase-like protein
MNDLSRRGLLESLAGVLPVAGARWDDLPDKPVKNTPDGTYDAIIVGAGLGGLSAAAAFARKGYRTLTLERHDKPGGYATAFRRGGFTFDVSLHSTSVGERDGLRNLIGPLPEITDVEFVPHPNLFRVMFPGFDMRIPQRAPDAFARLLAERFPDEKAGIDGLFEDMRGLAGDVNRLQQLRGQPDMRNFAKDYPNLVRCSALTWGQMVDARLKDAKLKGAASWLWGYYGLPPSKLSAFYYAIPTIGYLTQGGYYPKGRSQAISDSVVRFIESHGGTVLTKTGVDRILVENGAAVGVRCSNGTEYRAKAIVSNASAELTFDKLLEPSDQIREYHARMAKFSRSLSSFQVFLGLRQDLVGKLGIKDSEIGIETGFDPEASYAATLKADLTGGGLGVMLYDNVYPGYSPKGKNTINIMALQGYEHWKPFEADYRAGRKAAYRAEKERLARVMIERVEAALLPGLAKAIEVKEIGTPLTNWRYTSNPEGAIYGWDQTVGNSGNRRVGHATTVKGLYLAGAWSQPGHGYGAVLASGPSCCAQIVRDWGK